MLVPSGVQQPAGQDVSTLTVHERLVPEESAASNGQIVQLCKQFYKTFYSRNLQLGLIGWRI
jgi:hypothetical protein